MEPGKTTYRSVEMKPRDKVVAEKHRKELEAAEQRYNKLRRTHDENLKQLHVEKQRGNHLATSLGFFDISEAQFAIDNADRDVSYKDCFDRLDTLQDEFNRTRRRVEELQALLEEHEAHQEKLRKELAASQQREAEWETKCAQLRDQLQELGKRYDTLLSAKERAAKRYKSDYARWRRVRDWMFSDVPSPGEMNDSTLTLEDKKKQYIANVMQKKKILMELGPEFDEFDKNTASPASRPPPLGGITNVEFDKENLVASSPPSRTPPTISRLVSATAAKSSRYGSNSIRHQSVPQNRVSQAAPASSASSTPTLFNNALTPKSARTPLRLFPIAKQKPQSARVLPFSRDTLHPPSSSDTEEESQAIGQPFIIPTSPATSPIRMASSVTEPDSQVFSFIDPTPIPPQPAIVLPGFSTRPNTCPQPRRVISQNSDGQPTKIQRLNYESTSYSATGHGNSFKPGEELSVSSAPMNKGMSAEEHTPTPKNAANKAGQEGTADYSAFKGRGRYAKEISAKDTINAKFEIDPAHNGGLDFSFDEVVRNKDDRRRLGAGDCEWCKDYYDAIGPLPERLRAPLWRSPSRGAALACTRHHQDQKLATSHDRGESEAASHKQAISRHREQWDRAKTPPGYWDIGFPSTQETNEINEKAREMHRQKRAWVEEVAKAEGGRYRRRT